MSTLFPPHFSAIERIWFVLLRVIGALTLAFLLLPILVLVPLSFNPGSFLAYPLTGFSLQWYAQLFQGDEWRQALYHSLLVAPAASAIATVLGTLAALGLHHAPLRGKGLLMAVLVSPMIVPVVIAGLGMYLFYARIGLNDSLLGLIVAHAALGAPFVVTTVSAVLQGFDRNLARASLGLGAGPLRTLLRVTLPLIAPGVASGALFAFATSFDEVVVTLFLAGPGQETLPRRMFAGIRENISPAIAALATLLILLSTGMLLLLEYARRRARAVAPI